MRICYFGNDALSSCLRWFLKEKYDVFLICVNDVVQCADEVKHIAFEHNIPVFGAPPSEALIEQIMAAGCELIFVADYQHKIPVNDLSIPVINCHMSLLPEGRGPTPLPYLIYPHQQHAGLTLHKITEDWDEGDIILQEPVRVLPDETLDTLMVKMHRLAPDLLERLMGNFDELMAIAEPQGEGSYWPKPNNETRIMDWQLPCEALKRRIRQFGSQGVYLKLDNQLYLITSIITQVLSIDLPPGHVVFQNQDVLAISCQDGFVIIDRKHLIKVST